LKGLTQGPELTADLDLRCDVCIVGSGAGGSVLAAELSARGLDVVILEEGGYHTKADFTLHEADAYPLLYQERGLRTTADLAVTVLQGRGVGGSTVVNWTTCFRTPDDVLEHWATSLGIEGLDPATLAPHFDAVEARLGIAPWSEELVNANNGALLRGARALGWEASLTSRNVRGCANSGYCGLGCPVDGKQAMHLTYVPDALASGARLYANCRAERFEVHDDRVVAVHARVLNERDDRATGVRVTVRPKVAVSAGGAINGPALLLRSGLNANGRVGRRTFLHPVVAVSGLYEDPVQGYWGAPQSVSSHEFIDRGPDKVGYFLEAAPVHPMLASTAFNLFGGDLARVMGDLSHIGVMIAVIKDGFEPGNDGGTVTLRRDGRVRIDYPIGDGLQEAMHSAHRRMAQVHLAAGAHTVGSLHNDPVLLSSDQDLGRLDAVPYGALQHTIFTAHQMGGCAMGPDPDSAVVDATLRHHHVPNLFVVDGSVFPTSLGVNPSESIYGLAHWAADGVASAV